MGFDWGFRPMIGTAPSPTYVLILDPDLYGGLVAVWDYRALAEEYARYGEEFSEKELLRLIWRVERLIGDWVLGWEGWEGRRFPFPFHHLVLFPEERDFGRVLFGPDLEALKREARRRALNDYAYRAAPLEVKRELLEQAVADLAGFRALAVRKRL
ncbi:hypothetical protein [Thermus phage TSP4]|nr:hypothetical protein [Thermus phage TSP4]